MSESVAVQRLFKIAVTGGIASGKSTVRECFEKLGCQTISADHIVHELLTHTSQCGKKVFEHFGTLDRKKLSSIVFNNELLLKELEACIHPYVRTAIDAAYENACRAEKKSSMFVVEVPLLFESGLDHSYDKTIAVVAPEDACVERFCSRTPGATEKEYRERAKYHLSQEQKAHKADIVLNNNSDLETLKKSVTALHTELLREYRKSWESDRNND